MGAIGQATDIIVDAGASGTVNSKLRRMTQQLDELITGQGLLVDGQSQSLQPAEDYEWVEVNLSGSGDTSVLSGLPGLNFKIRAITLVADANAIVTFKSGETVLLRDVPLAPRTPFSPYIPSRGLFCETVPGDDFIIAQPDPSVNPPANIHGFVIYEEVF